MTNAYAHLPTERPDTGTEILGRFPLVRSTDPEQFVAAINQAYGAPTVALTAPGCEGQQYELRAIVGEGFTVGYLRSGLAVSIAPPASTGPYYLNLAPSGAVLSEVGDARIVNDPTTAVIMPAGARQRLTPGAHATESIGIKIDRSVVDAELTALLGREPRRPVQFAPALDLTGTAGAGIAALVRFMLSQASQLPGGLFDQPTVQLHHIRTLVAALLTMHQHNYSDALARPAVSSGRSRILRLALEYAERHLAEPLTVSDIAEAVGCSVRTLHEHFQAGVGDTPMGWVREQRLRHVHEELCTSGRSVTDVAFAWGFTHLGRFSAVYRKRYGVLPSDTVRKA
ncbi:helix-turn-helix transcriptional regulator [Streptomyces mayonensis]|uniref:helix-turn-helix transcriptional regulator n=1 Tax=Streptomyces mayonensis TaxID=2750816 RepID=UPI001C1E8B74|nr:AraC family transcriptional regulator [Streptomyces sp. A108]MBU6529616.1 AraC family transcriptional regulator [Streptomyces sp. A108]